MKGKQVNGRNHYNFVDKDFFLVGLFVLKRLEEIVYYKIVFYSFA